MRCTAIFAFVCKLIFYTLHVLCTLLCAILYTKLYIVLYTIQYTVLHSKWLAEMASSLGNINLYVRTVHGTVHCTLYSLLNLSFSNNVLKANIQVFLRGWAPQPATLISSYSVKYSVYYSKDNIVQWWVEYSVGMLGIQALIGL